MGLSRGSKKAVFLNLLALRGQIFQNDPLFLLSLLPQNTYYFGGRLRWKIGGIFGLNPGSKMGDFGAEYRPLFSVVDN